MRVHVLVAPECESITGALIDLRVLGAWSDKEQAERGKERLTGRWHPSNRTMLQIIECDLVLEEP